MTSKSLHSVFYLCVTQCPIFLKIGVVQVLQEVNIIWKKNFFKLSKILYQARGLSDECFLMQLECWFLVISPPLTSSPCHVPHLLLRPLLSFRSLASCFPLVLWCPLSHLPPLPLPPPRASSPPLSPYLLILVCLPCVVSPALRMCAACICWCVLTDRGLTLS